MSIKLNALYGIILLNIGCGGSQSAPAPTPTTMTELDAGLPPPTTASTTTAPPPAQAGPCDATQTLAITTALQARQATEAPGMSLDSTPACGVVAEGQSTSGPFMLQPGYCYTVLAQGLPQVSDVNVQIEMDVSGNGMPPALAVLNLKPVLAVDDGSLGPQASIGPKTSCYQWSVPVPLPAKVVVKSQSGAGAVGAQVFRKKKN